MDFIKNSIIEFSKISLLPAKAIFPKNIKTIGFAAIGGDFDAELDIKRIILYK